MKVRGDMAVRGAAFILGLAIAFSAVVAWRVPPGEGVLGADVIVAAANTGVVHADPVGPFLSATGLQPGTEGRAASEELSLTNISALPQVVQVRALPTGVDLDEVLWVEVDAAGHRVFRGPLGDLRSASPGSVTIASGQTRTLTVSVWIPEDAAEDFRGRIESIDLEVLPRGVRS
ncbi:MAG: hypothetical protein WEA54_05170 [Actinomycetota bacterium]